MKIIIKQFTMKNLFIGLRKGLEKCTKLIIDLDLPSACGHAIRH